MPVIGLSAVGCRRHICWLTLMLRVVPFPDLFGSANMPCCDELLMDYSGSLFCQVDPIPVI